MELTLKKEKRVNYPTKTTINFISDTQHKMDRAAIIAFVVFMLLLGVFVKFAILNPLNKISKAEAAYRQMDSQLNVYREQLKDYSDVQAQYNEVVGTFLNEKEAEYLDRTDIIKMINEDIKANVDIESITISGNTARVRTSISTMDNISAIVNTLLSDTRNSYVTVTTTQAEKSASNDQVYADLVINYSGVVE